MIRRAGDQDERPVWGKRRKPKLTAPASTARDREANGTFFDLACRAGRHEDGSAVVGELIVVGVAHVDTDDAMARKQGSQPVGADAEVGRIGVHEDERHLTRRVRALQFARHPIELRFVEPEVGPAGAGGNDVQKQAAMPVSHNGFRQARSAENAVERLEATRMKVVVARQDVQRDRESLDRRAHQTKLVFGAIVGVVAGQDCKTDPLSETSVGLVDQRQEVAMVLLAGPA